MRIQHNIAAMNSYRNFSANGSKLQKNLEKLSTGYKINRAGDDAAGLAISEKMRAQITGLDGATRNAKDGISLVQTAEGALTEVHDMLNRMVTLTEQSANGTYDDSLDRDQLQKEVTQLKSEIDRIADSTNYNGIKLLDGSLSGGGSLQGNIRLNNTEAKAAEVTTNAFAATTRAPANGADSRDSITYSISFTDSNGKEQKETISFHYNENQDKLVSDYDGTQYAVTSSANTTAAELANAVLGELQKNKNVNSNFDVKLEGTTALNFKSKVTGSGGAVVNSTDTKFTDYTTGVVTDTGANTITRKCNPVDEFQKLDFSNIKVLDKTNLINSGDIANAVKQNTFTIDGHKAVLVASTADLDDMKNYIGDDTHIIKLANTAASSSALTGSGYSTTANAADSKTIAAELSRLSGREFKSASGQAPELDAGMNTAGEIYLKGEKVSMAGKSLDLQIGDTSDSFNKLSVSIQDMHVNAMGLANVDIGSQEGAAAAMDTIKSAVNYVSNTRGTLGALQNRLDHTINNLGVMKENITSSESLIRDTDVAEEMMTYTKNNILNQAAQAMLAQANQLPQGVLQLLG